MHILVSNDDGIHAAGLWALAASLAGLGRVTVAAPDREQSGVGTALSLGRHIRAHRLPEQLPGVTGWAVEGTPADAVLLGVQALAGGPVDAVVSGINLGANVGHDTAISGTIGAALQGHFAGVFALAVSLATIREPDWRAGALLARLVVAGRRDGRLGTDLFLNLNLPNRPPEALGGLAMLPVGQASFIDAVAEEFDHKGNRQYRIVRQAPASDVAAGSDVWGLRQGLAVLTPLRLDEPGDVRWEAVRRFCDETWAAWPAAIADEAAVAAG